MYFEQLLRDVQLSSDGKMVAIKRILPSVAEDDEFISMFRDEATIASQLDHPNIVEVLETVTAETCHEPPRPDPGDPPGNRMRYAVSKLRRWMGLDEEGAERGL